MLLIIFLLVSLVYIPAYATYAIGIPLGSTAPDFTLNTIDGETISFSEYKDKVVILIYWSTDQERSISALKDGMDIYNRFKDKGVEVISLNAESDRIKAIKKIIGDLGIGFPVLIDSDRQVYGDYGIRAYPTTIIINRAGRLIYNILGYTPTYKITLEGYVRHLLGEIDEARLKKMISSYRTQKDESVLDAERNYNLALRFTEARLINQAINAVKKSIEANPDIIKFHILLGFLYLEQKKADKAIQEFNTVLRLDPDSHDAKTGLGGALILKGDIERAIEILNSAAIANPYPQMTYYELARAYELKGERDKAIEMYKKAVDRLIKGRILPSWVSKCR
jgi:tetratricopeptide (TPR) repeat protein